MTTLKHQVWIDTPIETVYQALENAEGLSSWWAPHSTLDTPEGTVLTHSPGPLHGDVHLLITKLVPNSEVVWKVTSSHPAESPASSWTGTQISFSLSRRPTLGAWAGFGEDPKEFTVLEFEHSGWADDSPFLGFCNFAWGETLLMLHAKCTAK